ncbi:MAG: phosphatidate cytidylyltransferase [Bacteroidales bacterium]
MAPDKTVCAGEIAVITTGIVIFAFSGDIFFSWYKRQYKVKDFSNVLPGHGGFLDRFDSLIAAGAFISLYSLFPFF